jgi:hypothetical protein
MNIALLFIPIMALSTLMEYLLFSGAILLVAGVVVFWAAVVRKPKDSRLHHYRPSARAKTGSESLAAAKPAKRRRRRSEPPLNPTLAETRGLPPLRESQPAANEHYQY